MNTVNNTRNSGYKTKFWFTAALMMLAGFVIFFTLVAGTLTDNRFGVHLVFNSDLISSPMWFLISASVVSGVVFLAGAGLLFMNMIGMTKVTESHSRILRIGSFFLMAIPLIMFALSSVSFAAFNSKFFISQLFDGNTTNMVGYHGGKLTTFTAAYADQGFIMGIMTIVLMVLVIAFTLWMLSVYKRQRFNDKIYYTARNTSIAMIAITWFAAVLNIVGFGAMGGDAQILFEGIVSNTNPIPLNLAGMDITIDLSTMTLQNLMDVIVKIDPIVTKLTLLLDGVKQSLLDFFAKDFKEMQSYINSNEIVKSILQAITYTTKDGVETNLFNFLDGLKPIPVVGGNATWALISAGAPAAINLVLNPILNPLNNLTQSQLWLWLGINHTWTNTGMLGGVNDSSTAMLLFIFVVASPLLVALYATYMWTKFDSVENSFVYRGSLWTILFVTILFVFLSITPYIPVGDKFEYGVLAPGLIAPANHMGGIHSAIVYFMPDYHGTYVWWGSFMLMVIIPIASFLSTALNKYIIHGGSNPIAQEQFELIEDTEPVVKKETTTKKTAAKSETKPVATKTPAKKPVEAKPATKKVEAKPETKKPETKSTTKPAAKKPAAKKTDSKPKKAA